MLLPTRFATSARLSEVRRRLVAARDRERFEGRATAPLPAVAAAMRPVVKQDADGGRARTAVTVTAVAVTAAVATAAYVWWRRHDQDARDRPHLDATDDLYMGPPSWRNGDAGVATTERDEASPAPVTADVAEPSIAEAPLTEAVLVEEPPAAADLEVSAIEVGPASEDRVDDEVETAVEPVSAEAAEPASDDTPQRDDRAESIAGEAGSTGQASDERPADLADRPVPPRRPNPSGARHGAPSNPRLAPRAGSQPLTQPQFNVPSSGPRLPGGRHSPLP